MAVVVDYSWSRPTVEQLQFLGAVGVMRYLATGPANAGKVLSITERNRLWAAEIPIGLVWEQDAGRPRGGYSAGYTDGQEATRLADRLEFPRSVPIAFAVDYDPRPPGELAKILDYFRGVLDGCAHEGGSYGSRDLVDTLAGLERNGRRVVCHWQCAAWSGTAGFGDLSVTLDNGERRRRSPHACMVQDMEATRLAGTDVNHVFGPVDFLYHPDIARPTGGPTLEDQMGKALNGEAAGLEGLWTLETAFGELVRRKVISPPQHRLLAAAGHLEQGPPGDHGYGAPVAPVVLDPELAGELKATPVAPGPNGALGLAAQVIGQIKLALTEDDDVTVDAQAVADKVLPRLQAAVEAAVDAQLDAAGRALAD